MGRYSKLIGSIVGSLISIAVLFAAFAGFGTCETDGVAETCTVAGFSYTTITMIVMTLLAAVGVERAPKNTP